MLLHCVTTRLRASSPMACNPGRRSKAVSAAARPSGSAGSKSVPTVSSTICGSPPTREAATGTRQLMASSAATLVASSNEGNTATAAEASSPGISRLGRVPRKRTLSLTPSSRASASSRGRSGPSPTSTASTGSARRISGSARIRYSTPFFWNSRRGTMMRVTPGVGGSVGGTG
ncbi:MAG: hypothetical protein FIB01_06380 [Gemmatimonadetes bacterium]|nr:hypothetical protein [Gemmatimonadota bacterium]